MPKSMRRLLPRSEVRLEAHLSLNEETWKGTALNLSLTGVYVVFNNKITAVEDQPIDLEFITDVGVLGIRGKVRGLRNAADPRVFRAKGSTVGLAVEFDKLTPTEEQIFASLLAGLREQSVSVNIRCVLRPHQAMEQVLAPPSPGNEITHVGSPDEGGRVSPERRLVPRVDLAIPIHVVPCETFAGIMQLPAQTANLSVSGLCICLEAPLDLLGQRFLLNLTRPQVFATQKGDVEDNASGSSVTVQVVWSAPDTTNPVGGIGLTSTNKYRIGVRFLHHHNVSQREIAELVEQTLSFPSQPATTMITSEIVECHNKTGHRIVAYHDGPQGLAPESPLVIIAPGFGETKTEYIALAYYLACNGFRVLRFDYTNQPGESDGEIVNTTMTGMNQDLGAIIDFAKKVWPTNPITVVAASLAGRVALKRAAQDHRVDFWILITSVVDLQATLVAAHHQECMVTFLRGVHLGVMNLLGLNVDADRFTADAIKEGYTNLQTTILDAQQIRAPVLLFAAEHDAWVQLGSMKAVQAAFRSTSAHLHLMPDALHFLHADPRKARAVFRHIVACCMERFHAGSTQRALKEPPESAIISQSRLEFERARGQQFIGSSEQFEFWRDYLDQFDCVVNVYDYWQLLDHIFKLMGPFPEKVKLLDAGCGAGSFGTVVLVNQTYRQRISAPPHSQSMCYVGLDFLRSALTKARHNLAQIADEIQGTSQDPGMAQSPVEGSFICADLNSPLPFRENQFNRVICNLTISYLQDPSFTVGELMRVLSPKGKLVITSLKPHADLFQIYRNVIQQADQSGDNEEAKRLLVKLSKIKQAEGAGGWRSYDRQELAMLLIAGGAVNLQIHSGFANQAYVAVVEKPAVVKVSPVEHAPPSPIPFGEYPLDRVGRLPQHQESPVHPIDAGRMQRVNEYQFYRLGAMLHPLSEIKAGTKLRDVATQLFQAQDELVVLLNDKVVPLVQCKPMGLKLLGEIAKLLKILPQGQEKELDHVEAYGLTNGVREFESIFSAELQALYAYAIAQKGIYSTPDLIGRAENLLPEAVRNLVPGQAIADIRQAGKCLGFDLSTAAGFHILRAIEAVVREYYRVVVKKQPQLLSRNWGAYFRVLRRNDADPNVLSLLEQIRQLYRNPSVHPDSDLSLDEVTALLGIAQSAIMAMVMDMEKRRNLSASASLPKLV